MAEESPKDQHTTPTSTSELMTSAKTVAEAAQLACSQQTDKIDKAKVAGAAEDILGAAKTYGKLEQTTGIGQYVDKAEGYLHQLHGSSDTHPPKEKPSGDGEGGGGDGGGLKNVAKGLGGFFK
ncbi:nodulin-related protein 1-like [Amaranthus tricolor]|uniref:nodulin-related protein 1-like n=1 Tax=Amaranthus tricolor TaxID=29722 RepID=UPI00258CD427|nr:nodulin-related protein 1-like [Amaranthus tricolor]